jgi:hypothetical protein
MFPNVRLMIAAMAASVVVLSCGFGVFAAFRVNHEPLARLPAVTAPVQHVAENPPPASVTIATKEPFDSRFRFRKPEIDDDAAEVTASIAPSVKPSAAPAVEPTERTAPTVHAPEPDSAPLGAPEQKLPAQSMQALESGSDPVADTAAQVAAAPPVDQAQPAEETAPTTEQTKATEVVPAAPPKTAAKPAARPAVKVARKTVHKVAPRQRVAIKMHRARRSHAHAFAQFSDESSDLAQPNFQSAPPNGLQNQPVRARRVARRSAVGGPFVSPAGY